MFECHITFENVDAELEGQLVKLAQHHRWKTSFIDGDPALGPGKRFFLTSHDRDCANMFNRMKEVVRSAPVAPVREKIEEIVYDTKYSTDGWV